MRSSIIKSLTPSLAAALSRFVRTNPMATERAKEAFVADRRRELALREFDAEQKAPGMVIESEFSNRPWMAAVMGDGFQILGAMASGRRNPTWVVAIRRDVLGLEFIGKGRVAVWLLKASGTDPKAERSIRNLRITCERKLGLNVLKRQPTVADLEVEAPIAMCAPVPNDADFIIEEAVVEPLTTQVEVAWTRLSNRHQVSQVFMAVKAKGHQLGATLPATSKDLKAMVERHPRANEVKRVIAAELARLAA